jgi:Ca2+-binding EF-hand superfamily protein
MSYDSGHCGLLQETEFEQAMTSLMLGLSDAEIQEVRKHLQNGKGGCVNVDFLMNALDRIPKMVVEIESWGRGVLVELTQEAAKHQPTTGGVSEGAHVKVKGLTSVTGQKINGSDGIVQNWDPANSRWVVKLTSEGALKSIRDENLLLLRPGASAAPAGATGLPDTKALYRLFCEGGEAAVSEQRFLSVVKSLLPRLSDKENQNLLVLMPKTQKGSVDVPEVLAQFVTGNGVIHEQTMRRVPMPGPEVSGIAASPQPKNWNNGNSGHGLTASPQPQSWAAGSPLLGTSPLVNAPYTSGLAGTIVGSKPPLPPGGTTGMPGAVQSPHVQDRFGRPTPFPIFDSGGSSSSTARGAAPPQKQRVVAEVALLRLAQRLLRGGRGSAPAPGIEILRLFTDSQAEIRLGELCDAASVLPLGVSRSEVQSIFTHVRVSSGRSLEKDVLPFSVLEGALKAAIESGVPSDAGVLEQLDFSRLANALQRLGSISGSRACALQDFRFSLMQAEPYLTPTQVEWLIMLTDKDGEGRLLPWSLLIRLCPDRQANLATIGGAVVALPEQQQGLTCYPVAPKTPRQLVVGAIVARLCLRLNAAGPNFSFEHIFGLFDLDAKSKMNRFTLVSLLSELRLGISASEADELLSGLLGVGAAASPSRTSSVTLSNFSDYVRQVEERDGAAVADMRDRARDRFVGRGDILVNAIENCDGNEHWLPEDDFRRCLCIATTNCTRALTEDQEDRIVLLAEKNALGQVRWRDFAKDYAGWFEPEVDSEPQSPIWKGFETVPSPSASNGIKVALNFASQSQQSWRTSKAQEKSLAKEPPTTVFEEQRTRETDQPATRCSCCIS